jgi:hypothetical protein
MLCGLVDRYQCFGETNGLHLQGNCFFSPDDEDGIHDVVFT